MLQQLLQSLWLLSSFCLGSQLSSLKNSLNIKSFEPPIWNLDSSIDDELFYLNNFRDLSFYSYTGRENFTKICNETQVIYYSNFTYIELSRLDKNSVINFIIPWKTDAFILSGYGSFGNYTLQNQLLYNLTDLSVKEILNFSKSSSYNDLMINSILVDEDIVYFGGKFNYTIGNETSYSLVMWNGTENNPVLPPFGGFGMNSTVNSILKIDEDNLLFAGNFNTLGNSSLLTLDYNVTNVTDIEFDQSVSLKYSISDSKGVNFSNLICPNNNGQNGWFVDDVNVGQFDISLMDTIIPSKIRLYNSWDDDHQIKLFRVVTTPSNSIMNLTYLDPISRDLKYCSAWCPLLNLSDLRKIDADLSYNSSEMIKYIDGNTTVLKWTSQYQEFGFVNEVPADGLVFVALESYGTGLGLNSIEIFQSEYQTYANNTLNQPNCNSNLEYSYSTLSQNNWYTPLLDESYIMTMFESGFPYTIFYPNIPYAGNYTLTLYTPGCIRDNTCDSRGIVNVTVFTGTTILSTMLVYQNNYHDKYDILYMGYLEGSPKISMEWSVSIGSVDGKMAMVSDKLGVSVNSINKTIIELQKQHLELNGLFQYQSSNFTDTNIINKVGNTTFNYYPTLNYPSNAKLYAGIYNSSVIVGGSVNGISKLDLESESNASIRSIEKLGTGGEIKGIYEYSEGIILVGQFNLSSKEVSSLTYNGTEFNTFGNIHGEITRLTNLNLGDSDLLVFNNEFIYNISSNSYISNSSSFSLSAWAAGSNNNGDLLFSGNIAQNDLTMLNGIISIDSKGLFSTNHTPTLSEEEVIYKGLYINSSSIAYAYYNQESLKYGVKVDNDGRLSSLPRVLSDSINAMIYNENENALIMGTNGTDDNGASLISVNLAFNETVIDESMGNSSKINSLAIFNSNKTLLVGGTFIKNDCNGICLFNYHNNSWSSFYDGFIQGKITDLQFVNEDKLLIAGDINVFNETNVHLLELDLKKLTTQILDKNNSHPFTSFITIDNSTSELIATDGFSVYHYTDGVWRSITTDFSSNSRFNSISLLSLRQVIQKRSDMPNYVIIVNGNLQHPEFGLLDVMYYDFQSWTPYIISSGGVDNNELQGEIFLNKNMSYLFDTQVILQSNATHPIHIPTSTPSHRHRKINRGYVILISLALALATISVIGIIAALIAYWFINNNNSYEKLEPRIDEAEMIDTVPPEKLMTFI